MLISNSGGGRFGCFNLLTFCDLLIIAIALKSTALHNGTDEPRIYKLFWLRLSFFLLFLETLIAIGQAIVVISTWNGASIYKFTLARDIGTVAKTLFMGSMLFGMDSELFKKNLNLVLFCICAYVFLIPLNVWPEQAAHVPPDLWIAFASLFLMMTLLIMQKTLRSMLQTRNGLLKRSEI